MDFDPYELSVHEDPYPFFRELRENHPILYSESKDFWVVSRYEDVRAVLQDGKTFASGQGTVPDGFLPSKPMMIVEDAPYHTHLRSAVSWRFRPRRLRSFEAVIEKVSGELARRDRPGDRDRPRAGLLRSPAGRDRHRAAGHRLRGSRGVQGPRESHHPSRRARRRRGHAGAELDLRVHRADAALARGAARRRSDQRTDPPAGRRAEARPRRASGILQHALDRRTRDDHQRVQQLAVGARPGARAAKRARSRCLRIRARGRRIPALRIAGPRLVPSHDPRRRIVWPHSAQGLPRPHALRLGQQG